MKFYDQAGDYCGDTVPTDLDCVTGLDVENTSVGFEHEIDFDLGLFSFEGNVTFNGKFVPDASAGGKVKLSEPQAIEPAVNVELATNLDACVEGELCTFVGTPWENCSDISFGIPTPTVDDITLIGEVVIPLVNFSENDHIVSVYLNPDGSEVWYEDLDQLSPVLRIAPSDINIDYSFEDIPLIGDVCIPEELTNLHINLSDLIFSLTDITILTILMERYTSMIRWVDTWGQTILVEMILRFLNLST